MKHVFDVDIATKYGVAEAIILENIYFWILHNKANNKSFYEGRYWTFNSAKAFAELFPYYTSKQIRKALDKLRDEGILLTGNFNKMPMDRTLWYSLSDEGEKLFNNDKCINQNGQMHLPKKGNAFPQNGTPIPYINEDINKDNNTAEELLSEVYDLYQNNIHPFTGQIEYQALTEAIKDFGAANVKEAIVIAAKNNGRSVSYVEKVAQNLSNGLNFDKKKASAPVISEEQRKRFEDILRGKIAIKDCTKLECKAITECGGTWEMKNRLEKDNDKWLRNLCNAYMELANGVREQDS